MFVCSGVRDWIQERRDERLEEFAPPSIYSDSQPKSRSHGHTRGAGPSQIKGQDRLSPPKDPIKSEDSTQSDNLESHIRAGLTALRNKTESDKNNESQNH